MAVVIILSRTGTSKKPRYRIVAKDSRYKVKGRNLQILGSYNPFLREKGLIVHAEKVTAWIKKGAKMSGTVGKLFKGAKISV